MSNMIECLKVEIKLTPIAIEHPYYKEMRYRPLRTVAIKEGAATMVNPAFDEIAYEVHQVWNFDQREKVNYLVQVDESRVFQDLVRVSAKSVEDTMVRRAKEAYLHGLADVRRMPWWKRLFKQF